jgi:nitrile hydratase accessory protein
LSPPDASEPFEALVRRHAGVEAVFEEPWQAQAFALAVHLHSKGAFTWQEWASTLADEIKRADALVESDDGTHYYEFWLAALERLVRERGLAEQQALDSRKEAWADAYRHTPHGKPVVLQSRGDNDSMIDRS